MLDLDNKTIIREKLEFLARWKDHFAPLLNESSIGEQHVVDNTEQKPTHHWMGKCSDLDDVGKVIFMFCYGIDELHSEIIKRGSWSRKFVEVHSRKIRMEKLGSSFRLEGRPTSHQLRGGRQKRL